MRAIRRSVAVQAAVALAGLVVLGVAAPAALARGTSFMWTGPGPISAPGPYAKHDVRVLDTVVCAPAGFCLAADDVGNLLVSSDPASGNWSLERSAPRNLAGFSCPSAGFCAAFDRAGRLYTATSPATGPWTAAAGAPRLSDSPPGAASLSCPSPQLCVAIVEQQPGNQQAYVTANPSGGPWSVIPGNNADSLSDFASVACPSVQLCVVVGQDGPIGVVANPGSGGSWSFSTPDGTVDRLGLSCPSPSLCVALDYGGGVEVSTNPQAGVWSHSSVDPQGVASDSDLDAVAGGAIACPVAQLCVLADQQGGVLTSTDPAAGAGSWTRSQIDGKAHDGQGDNQLNAISCASPQLCAAVDTGGNALSSTAPAGGVAAWHGAAIDGYNTLSDMSCPSVSLCVAVDGQGHILASSALALGAASWTSAEVDNGRALTAISCPTDSFCAAVDKTGHVLTPSGAAWRITAIDPGHHLEGIACPTVKLCVAADDGGAVISSVNPGARASRWRRIKADAKPLIGISCATARFCVAFGKADVVTSTKPAAGNARGWRRLTVDPDKAGDGETGLTNLACPTRRLCVGLDNHYNNIRVFSSTNPTSQSSWHVSHLLASYTHQPTIPLAFTCQGPNLCAAADAFGTAWISSAPAGRAWTKQTVHRGVGIDTLACPSARLCIAGDDGGNIIVGTR